MVRKNKIAESRCEDYTRKQLKILGWNTKSITAGGDVAEKQELRNYPTLKELMPRETPEFILFLDNIPRVVIECKALKEDIDIACEEAKSYAGELKLRIAIGVAGNEDDGVIVRNFFRHNSEFEPVTYSNIPLTQILSKTYVERILKSNKSDIKIDIPDINRFWNEADKIHNLFRNSDIPKQRMAVYLGTIILALSENPKILAENDFNDLNIINTLAQTKLGRFQKPDLKGIFKIPDPSSDIFNKLKRNLPIIINSLQRLDVLAVMQTGEDILGRFFEQFLRYANDKRELGIVFTPRHIIDFMCALADIKKTDIVLDPCCGTAGFLVAAFTIMQEQLNKNVKLTEEERSAELKGIKEQQIYGTESESDGIIYGLACLNMILRGDGNTNIKHKDCFTQEYDFKFDKVLINPPYSQSKKGTNGTPETKYLDYCLSNLREGGLLCAIIPYSIMCENNKWRKALVKHHTIIASISVPPELFYPISSPAVIVLINAHEPQNGKAVFLGRITDDGFEIDRQKRSKVREGQQNDILKHFKHWKALYDRQIYDKIDIPEFLITKVILDDDQLLEYVPEAHLSSIKITKQQIEKEIDFVLRDQFSFQLKYAVKLMNSGYRQNIININIYMQKLMLKGKKVKIKKLSDCFEQRIVKKLQVYCVYGQKELHDKRWLKNGNDIIISSSGAENGLYDFCEYAPTYKNPVLTCPSTGSISQSFVQEFPCSVDDNTLVFVPLGTTDYEILYYISALIRLQAWRYRYGRQTTPIRLNNMEVDLSYYDKDAIKVFRNNLPFACKNNS
jgi:type I restriction-modification system DNA methylase subunit